MKKTMVALSFDDARGDNTEIFREVLIPAALPSTLNVTTGYVDGTVPPELRPCELPAMTIEDVQECYRSGYVEMALHGNTHQNTEEDMAKCRDKLIRWLDLPEDMLFGMASPKSEMSLEGFAGADNGFFHDKVLYLRSGLRLQSRKGFRVFFRKLGRVWHRPEFYRIAYRDTIMKACDDRIIYAVPILGDITLKQVVAIVEDSIAAGGAICLMFHSIQHAVPSGDNWTWSRKNFEGLCQWLSEMRNSGVIDVVTTRDMYAGLQE